MSENVLTQHAKESQHFYYRDGTPCYEVLSADGKRMVQADIRHARKLGLVPGVTSIISCADKPGLTVWKIEQAILSSLTLTRRPHEPDREFLRRIFDDSAEQAKKAAEIGTAIHAAIEGWYGRRQWNLHYADHLTGAIETIRERFGEREWLAEKSFAHCMGYGSKIDLISLGDGVVILDSKGKEFDEKPSATNKVKLHWDEHAMQLAAYRRWANDVLGATDVVCGNLFFSRNVPGLCHIHVWDDEELDRGWEQFKALHAYWCATKKYDPSFLSAEEAKTFSPAMQDHFAQGGLNLRKIKP